METATYRARRRALRENVADGLILLPGNEEAPRNYTANTYPFRQDSTFLYYTGCVTPGLVLVLTADGTEILFGDPQDPDDIVWSGRLPGPGESAAAAGIDRWERREALAGILADAAAAGQRIHYLPPYRASTVLQLAAWLSTPPAAVAEGASGELIRAVVAQREIKSAAEVAEIEYALGCSALMYRAAMSVAGPGLTEARVAGMMQGVALMEDLPQAFPPIVTVHGEILHCTRRDRTLQEGQLLLLDSGVESPRGYCSDITRTIPVSGVYSPRQRGIYEVVLRAQQTAIDMAAPGVTNRALHLAAARTLVEGLRDVGLMRGDIDEAVACGAHALFFPHGLGHMLGLDVHDMENLGDAVGYAEGETRSDQFGLNYLRLAKELRPGFVLTVEPGCYFIPALIDAWRAQRRHEAFIDYAAVEKYRDFGGIRIEDDILVTEDGCRVLGTPIPKTADDIELFMQQAREQRQPTPGPSPEGS